MDDGSDPADRYRRLTAAVEALSELAAGSNDAGLAKVLAGDEVVLARMRAAAALLEEDNVAGVHEPGGFAGAAGPGFAGAAGPGLRTSAAADLARGQLLLRARQNGAGKGPLTGRARLRRTRIELLGRTRTRCAVLRAELREDVARVNGRRIGGFIEHVHHRVDQQAATLSDEVDWEICGAGFEESPVRIVVPAPQSAGAENRLTAVFGGAFGLGAALTLARVAAGAVPGWPAAAVAFVSIAGGVALAGWVIAARRTLTRRMVLDRWVSEIVAALRAAVEERIAIRMLEAETAEVVRAVAARDGVGRFPGGDGDQSDILAITDRVHEGVNVQVRDGRIVR